MWKTARLSDQRILQQQRKGALQLAALTSVGIDAMVPGQGDLSLGLDWLKQQAADVEAPYTAANLICDGERPFPPSRSVTVTGLDILVVGVLSQADQVPEPCTVSPAHPAVMAAVDAQPTVDLVVVLSRLDTLSDEALAEAIPRIDLVVGGGSKIGSAKPRMLAHGAAKVEVGTRGKKLGVARVHWDPAATGFVIAEAITDLEAQLTRMRKRRQSAVEHKARAKDERSRERQQRRVEHYDEQLEILEQELSTARAAAGQPGHTMELSLRGLTADIADHPATAAKVEAALAEIESMEATAVPAGPLRGPYMGSAACAGCHAAQYAQWKGTPHAHAWRTLVDQRRHMDLDCFSCHVTGAFHPEGPGHPSQVGKLQNVGCEACHGPGRAHVGDPTTGGMVTNPPPSTCTQCHDGVQDEGRFNYETYLPKVVHSAPDGAGPGKPEVVGDAPKQ